MGGSAFNAVMNANACPRIPPPIYHALKSRFTSIVAGLYIHATTPKEAPEKKDHGDLDLIVAIPRREHASQEYNKQKEETWNVLHETVRNALGAMHMVPCPGNRTSNFAIPVKHGEWDVLGYGEYEKKCRKEAEGDIFYQVDIHVCADEDEWKRIRFFHAYGDLGMILGVIARNNGLMLGAKGLKMSNPPHKTIELSNTFEDITRYLGLSMERWEAGFTSKAEVFQWAATSRFFNPAEFRSQGQGFSKVKAERGCLSNKERKQPEETRAEKEIRIRNEALVHFGKKYEVDEQKHQVELKKQLKNAWNGKVVMEWVELGNHWMGVKQIMENVRERCGGDEGVIRLLEQKDGQAKVKLLVFQAKEELGLHSREKGY
ncbi:hypothetical protein BDN72DRAFT_886254 [Pluteus cervinus]|uniref:Uncharacterized protein n=1 Tax=Pluteus cervinus TaxID=181527 RepID=A0ACD3BAN2_9AGAR|nr:hypothetical protein BDN72DRAFT_886254 [Pluteus cervinus]